MKAHIYDIKGEKKSQVELPKVFETPIRKDIVEKTFEAMKKIQPYSNDPRAGKEHSASGRIRHQRHKWGSHYGKGISRVPRKTMWRSGTQFGWVGASVSGTRGGRRAHGPELNRTPKRINKKELMIAINSGLAATAHKEYIQQRYANLDKVSFEVPIILDLDLHNLKMKEFEKLTQKLFGELPVFKERVVRAGKGKSRGRRYKIKQGILFVIGNEEKAKVRGVDVVRIKDLEVSNLYPLGRITTYSKKAIEELAK